MNCVSNLVQRDPAVEVRRAAVLLITLLLKGLDKEALLVGLDCLSHLTIRCLNNNLFLLPGTGAGNQRRLSDAQGYCAARRRRPNPYLPRHSSP